jgi:hypothetical protein
MLSIQGMFVSMFIEEKNKKNHTQEWKSKSDAVLLQKAG